MPLRRPWSEWIGHLLRRDLGKGWLLRGRLLRVSLEMLGLRRMSSELLLMLWGRLLVLWMCTWLLVVSLRYWRLLVLLRWLGKCRGCLRGWLRERRDATRRRWSWNR